MLRSSEFVSHLRLDLKSENPMPNGVWFRFHHGTTFTSWGEKITITLIPTAEMTTSVTILSECGMPTQVIDWGKNRQNVCNIYEHIVRMLSAANVPTTPTQSPAPAPAQNPIPEQNTEAPKPSVSFCNSCGTRVVPGSIFCSGCGKKL